ncbi:aromatic acid exporter family protein [Clostridium sp. MB40-C1]|uniref:FUSC family protein n=1 Tax=Clostridium sp. MB40-C1 TaxID=3070996 RepID=UPI0027E0EE9B|nr:aromatic acid exporter family protein [Clostridium sp. MB40-C1]WMJ81686.1 aromatic acid exporter family protein [Clostridium sp. MB40-C1]
MSNSIKLIKTEVSFFCFTTCCYADINFFGETIKFGINRIIGSTIGAIIGIVLVNIQLPNILLVAIGVILIIYVCNYLKWDSSTSIACLVFVSIIVSAKETSAFQYSLHRLIDTFIGIAITTIVNNYIFNPDVTQLLKEKAKNTQKTLLNIANNKNFSENKNELDKIELNIYDMKNKLKICNEEFKFDPKFSLVKDKLESMVYSITIIFEQIKIINYINANNYESTNNITNSHLNNINTIIGVHKNIFFNEIKNLNKIINDMP